MSFFTKLIYSPQITKSHAAYSFLMNIFQSHRYFATMYLFCLVLLFTTKNHTFAKLRPTSLNKPPTHRP